MAATSTESIDVPYRDPVTDQSSLLTTSWSNFFRSLFERIMPLGVERSFQLVNNQSAPADVVGLKVNARAVSQAIVEYLVQRVTTGSGATELIESGSFLLTYNPTTADWNFFAININNPDDSGVGFSVDPGGQVQYSSSSITGTASISRVLWRMRTLAGKSSQYSSQGTR